MTIPDAAVTASPVPSPPSAALRWTVRLLALLLAVPLVWMCAFTVRDRQAQSLAQLADVQAKSLDLDLAEATLTRAARMLPGDAKLQLALAKVDRSLWIFRNTPAWQAQADAAFRRAGALNPHWPLPAYEHARMYAVKLRYAEALPLLQDALDRDPNNAGFWLERARYLVALGRLPDAASAYATCQRLLPNPECARGVPVTGGQP